MTDLSSQNLLNAAASLLKEVGELTKTKNTDDALQLQRLEHCARALCGQLKAIQELDAHNLRQTQSNTGQKYTRYEDLPPLMPEERDRLKQELVDMLSPRGIRATETEPKRLSQ